MIEARRFVDQESLSLDPHQRIQENLRRTMRRHPAFRGGGGPSEKKEKTEERPTGPGAFGRAFGQHLAVRAKLYREKGMVREADMFDEAAQEIPALGAEVERLIQEQFSKKT